MVNTKHNKVLSKMLAVFARDAEPEEIEEAVEAIDEITSEQPVIEEEIEAKDEGPDKMDLILDKLDQLLAAKDCKDEAPEEDPLAKLENDLDELEKIEPEEEEDEDPVDPEKDPDEMEAHFVDPEQINEEDEDPEEIIAAEEEEEIPVADRRACDAARVALNAIKPILAKLPPSERKKAADAAVAQIRKSSGMDAKPKTNGYAALKKARKRIGDRANEADIGRRIMESRNPNYQK